MELYTGNKEISAQISQADPYMIKDTDGRYYMYTTGGSLFSSNSLKQGWNYEGHCLQARDQKNIWAPSVICLDGRYYMYYSSMNQSETNEHKQTMRMAVSDRPEGSFIYQKDMVAPFSIDPHVVKTPSGLYMFYSVNDYQAERPGTLIACDKMKDPGTMEGAPVPAVVPTIDEEIFKRDRFRKGQNWHTIEGAFYFYHEGIHYLMYSGASYQNPTYFIGYSVAHGREDADLRSLDWKKYPNADTYAPLMQKNDFVEGVGHNSVICDDGKWYVVYHGRSYDLHRAGDARTARIDEMKIDGEKLSVRLTP